MIWLPFYVLRFVAMKIQHFAFVFTVALWILMLLAANIPLNDDRANSSLTSLGHRLFFDERLSLNATKSCATCHAPELAFTDGYRQSIGIFADKSPRNAPSLLNLDSYTSLNWADAQLVSIKDQIEGPLFGKHPIEMGADKNNAAALSFIYADTAYTSLVAAAYPQKTKIDWEDITEAIAAYTAGLKSRRAVVDMSTERLSATEQQGRDLFESPRLGCRKCHSGIDFNRPDDGIGNNFHDIGLGKVRTPSLRNVAITAPYMNNGSIENLTDCVKIFTSNATLSTSEERALIAFLYTLTDTSYLADPYFRDPF